MKNGKVDRGRILQESKTYRDRWKASPWSDIIATTMGQKRQGTNIDLNEIIVLVPKTEQGLSDLRGFPLSAKEDGNRPRYRSRSLSHVDLSYSSSEIGHSFSKTIFENCCFSKSIWWCHSSRKNLFKNCDFSSIIVYSTNLSSGCRFENSVFDGMSARGDGFSFGYNSKFFNCSFDDVEIREIGTLNNVVFTHCKFGGTLRRGEIKGLAWERKANRFDLISLLFRLTRGVRFIKCDLSQLKLHEITIDPDVIVTDSILPSCWETRFIGTG